MYLERWKDTAFGTDYGNDFMEFIEGINSSPITMLDIYQQCDLKRFIDQPELVLTSTDVKIDNPDFEQFVHYEDAIIALAAIIIESESNGNADLTEANGNEIITFDITKHELKTIKAALDFIYNNPDNFELFKLCLQEEREETLTNIAEMLEQFQVCINKKN